MGLRDSILNIAPPWLLEAVGGGLLYTGGLILDAVGDAWLKEGIKARFPDSAPTDALGYIGNDRLIDRGPGELDPSYVIRLRQAIDTWRNAGGGRTILAELAAYFTNVATPPLRLVSDSSIWHEFDWGTKLTTRTAAAGNWVWDVYTGARWFRGWAIIDSTGAAPWTPDVWDLVGTWGDGGTWGSNATVYDVAAIRKILDRWKPAHITALNVIITFSATLFERTDASPPNPSGTSDSALWRLGYNAIFWNGVTT